MEFQEKLLLRFTDLYPTISHFFFQFNDRGPDINLNVEVREPTDDVVRFKQEIIGLEFESYNGGRDSKERLMQGNNFIKKNQ